ncbi:flagellar type III secretion system pore protein FliP [Vibrio sp.]|nr:flagellar type III secretion system pore protein FliP [Vibrio sp.]
MKVLDKLRLTLSDTTYLLKCASHIIRALVLLFFIVLLSSSLSYAQEGGIPFLSVTNSENGEQDYTLKLQVLILMTALSFIPAFVLMCTCFTRIIIVFAILRQAIGLQQSPPNQVLVGIALVLSMLIMRPVWTEIYHEAYVPFEQNQITFKQAIQEAEQPLRVFMLRQTHATALEQMMNIGGEPLSTPPEEVDFTILLPAYVISELKTAFQIGFMLFLPFLIIDMVVASALMSMGMMMLSPLIVSLPFKLLVFVIVDGWTMLVGSLATSF